MSPGIAHVTASGLPLSVDAASLVLAVGLVVLLVVAYDYYRHRSSGGE